MHYRNYKFFIPETHGYRIASTAKFFPAHCKMPAIEPGDTVHLATQDLIKALNTNSKAPLNLEPKHTEALRLLADIFQEAIPKKVTRMIHHLRGCTDQAHPTMQQLRGWLPNNPVSINVSLVETNPSSNLSLKKRKKNNFLKKSNKNKK
jgi:hypothetical protein